jgi:hypothetical protein
VTRGCLFVDTQHKNSWHGSAACSVSLSPEFVVLMGYQVVAVLLEFPQTVIWSSADFNAFRSLL